MSLCYFRSSGVVGVLFYFVFCNVLVYNLGSG